MIDIDAYMKEAREELDGGIYDGDYDMFLMLEQLQSKNKRLRNILRIGCYCNKNEMIKWLEENKVVSDQPFDKESIIVLRMIVIQQALKGT